MIVAQFLKLLRKKKQSNPWNPFDSGAPYGKFYFTLPFPLHARTPDTAHQSLSIFFFSIHGPWRLECVDDGTHHHFHGAWVWVSRWKVPTTNENDERRVIIGDESPPQNVTSIIRYLLHISVNNGQPQDVTTSIIRLLLHVSVNNVRCSSSEISSTTITFQRYPNPLLCT